jgi:hypothetical protein
VIVEIEWTAHTANSILRWRVRVTDDNGTGLWGASMWNCDLQEAIEVGAEEALALMDAERAEALTATIEP